MKSEIKLRDDCNETKMKRGSAGRKRETERQIHNKWVVVSEAGISKAQNQNIRIQPKYKMDGWDRRQRETRKRHPK